MTAGLLVVTVMSYAQLRLVHTYDLWYCLLWWCGELGEVLVLWLGAEGEVASNVYDVCIIVDIACCLDIVLVFVCICLTTGR